jgi:hypothetical protein
MRATPLLRLVVSNPHVRALGEAITHRGHLTLVAARATPMGPAEHVTEPWAEDEPRAYLMIVLGLAAAGLVAVATSIGRLITAAL